MALQNKYRSDLNWMKGVGWEADGCLNIAQAKKAGELLSDVSVNCVCVYILQFVHELYSVFDHCFIYCSFSHRQNTVRRQTASGSPRWRTISTSNTPKKARNCRVT